MSTEPGVQLHPKKGLNPRLTYCPRCHGEGPDLILVGANDSVITCPACGMNAIGFKTTQACPSCKKPLAGGKKRTLEERERLPGSICKDCEAELKTWDEEVKKGAVHVRCKTCGMKGLLKAEHPLSKSVRDHYNFHKGEPCGVEVDSCPQCEKNDGQARKAD